MTKNTERNRELLQAGDYHPEVLLDALLQRSNLRRDAQIARMLDLGGPMISKIRNRYLPITAEFLLRVHDVFDLDVDLSRKIAGIPLYKKGNPDSHKAKQEE